MKKAIIILSAITAVFVLWPSCNQTEETGELTFGLDLSEDNILKSAETDQRVTAALVTIIGENGDILYDKEHLPLYAFGSQYTTQSLKIPLGEYRLTEFMLIDDLGTVLWATPKEGSRLAHLVRHPLPIPFHITPDETTSVDVQVIRTGDHPPADFGYVNFDIGFVDRFCLKVFYSSRCMEEWNDSILGPDGTIAGSDGSVAPYYQPRITIWSGDRQLVNEPLMPGLNHYPVPIVSEWYVITATDCHGQVVYENKFPVHELMQYRCADNYPPLVIYRDPVPGILITPEGLKEPTIKQGVFGSISTPEDDSIYLDNYMVYPLVRDIYFYPYHVLDSIYTFAPMGCWIHEGFIPGPPTAIVRTNSDGIFQVPLEEGDYLYMVRDGDRYYIDAYVSSHPPGFVKVYPLEVTRLLIHIIDCSMWM
jgi:hypothetical protein